MIESIVIINLLLTLASLVLFIGFCFMPESPRYLSLHGKIDDAKKILQKFKADDRDVENDLQLWTNYHLHKKSYLSVFKEDFGITFAFPIFGLVIFQQLIGAIPLLFYLHKIFKLTGE